MANETFYNSMINAWAAAMFVATASRWLEPTDHIKSQNMAKESDLQLLSERLVQLRRDATVRETDLSSKIEALEELLRKTSASSATQRHSSGTPWSAWRSIGRTWRRTLKETPRSSRAWSESSKLAGTLSSRSEIASGPDAVQ